MNITEKAAYIKGLIDGMELDPAKKETKIINAFVDIIDDIARSIKDTEKDINDMSAFMDDLGSRIDAMDSRLSDVEDELYSGSSDDDGYNGAWSRLDGDDIWQDSDDDLYDEEDEEEGEEYEIECPECGKIFTFSGSVFDSDEPIKCPKCGCVIDEIEEIDPDDDED